MTVLDAVLETLRAMSLLQLLLAFMACTGYALAQGGLVGPRLRRWAWLLALVSAAGFSLESTSWTHAAMLGAIAIAALGMFAAAVWLMSRALGLAHSRRTTVSDGPQAVEAAQPAALRARSLRQTRPAPLT